MLTEVHLLGWHFQPVNIDSAQALYDRVIYPTIGQNMVRIHAAFDQPTVAKSQVLNVTMLVFDSSYKIGKKGDQVSGLTLVPLFAGHPNASIPFFEALTTCFSLSAFMHDLSISNQ